MATKLVNGVPVEMSPAEEAAFEAGRTPNLAQARRLMRDRIADRRSQAESGGFAHLTKRYDSRGGDLARLSILAERARTAKAAAGAFTVRVVASDDTEAAFNADEMIALEVSAGDHFLACSANARTLRQAVTAAADVALVLAVDIEAGWP